MINNNAVTLLYLQENFRYNFKQLVSGLNNNNNQHNGNYNNTMGYGGVQFTVPHDL